MDRLTVGDDIPALEVELVDVVRRLLIARGVLSEASATVDLRYDWTDDEDGERHHRHANLRVRHLSAVPDD